MQSLRFSEPRVSLCLTYPRLNEPDKNIKFRVADKIGDELVLVNYYQEEIETKMIYSRPTDSIPYKAEFVEWWYDPVDPRKTQSNIYESKNLYEIYIDKDCIRRWTQNRDLLISDLKKGIRINENMTEKFLLLTEDKGDIFRAILLDKKDLQNGLFKVSLNGDNFTGAITSLPEYTISKRDIISTEFVNIKTIEDDYVDRHFYRRTVLPFLHLELKLFGIYDYLPYLLKRFIKNNKSIFEVTNSSIKEISYFINEYIKDENELKCISEIIGSDSEDIKNELVKFREDITSYIAGHDDIDYVIFNIIRNNDLFVSKLQQKIQEDWYRETNTEKVKLESELFETKSQVELVTAELKNKEQEHKEIENSISKLIRENQILQQKNMVLEEDIIRQIDKYRKETLRVIGDNEIFKNLSHHQIIDKKSRYSINNGITYNSMSPEVDNIEYFIEDLSDNLRYIGLESAHAKDIAIYLTSLIYLAIPIIVPNWIAKDLANALSSLVENSSCSELSFDKSIDSNKIGDLLNSIEGRIVYITNFAEDIDENVLLNIANHKSKFIIIAYKDNMISKMLSQVVYDNCLILELDPFFTIPMQEELNHGHISKDMLCHLDSSIVRKQNYYTEYTEMLRNHRIRNSILIKHSKIKDAYVSLGGNRKNEAILFNEFSVLIDDFTTKKSGKIDNNVLEIGN